MSLYIVDVAVGIEVSYGISARAIRYGKVIELDSRLKNPNETVHTLRYFQVKVQWSHCIINGVRHEKDFTSWVRIYSLNLVKKPDVTVS